MKRKSSFLSLVLAICLILPAFVLFAGCGNKAELSMLFPEINGSRQSINVLYGNNNGLDNIKVLATYSDGTEKEIALSDLSLGISFFKYNEQNSSSISFEDYCAKVQANTLDCGSYEFKFTYKGFDSVFYLYVSPVEDAGEYRVAIKSGVHSSLALNHVKYGTKADAYISEIYKVGESGAINPQEVEYYFLCTKENNISTNYDVSSLSQAEIDALPTPKEVYNNEENYILNSFSVLENATPGTYLVCASLKADNNHNSTFTKYTKLVIEKADVALEATKYSGDQNIMYDGEYFYIDYTYNGFANLINDASFNDIIADDIKTRLFGNMKLVLKSDGISNNDRDSAQNKLTDEEVVEKSFFDMEWKTSDGNIGSYGKLVDVSGGVYNAQTNCYEVTVKFVSDSEFYNDSNTVKIALKVNRGPVNVQANDVVISNGTPSAIRLMYKTKVLKNATAEQIKEEAKQNVLVLVADFDCELSNQYTYGFGNLSAGIYEVKIYLNNNFTFYELDSVTGNFALTLTNGTSENELSYITLSWTVSE